MKPKTPKSNSRLATQTPMQIRCKQTCHLITILKKQTKTITVKQIRQVHAQAITRGLLLLHQTLIYTQILHTLTNNNLFASSHTIHYATTLFNLIPNPSTFCFNNIIRAHTLFSLPQNALHFFKKMCQLSIPPDTHSYPFALKACSQLKSLSLAKTLQSQALQHGFLADVYICNNLVHIYALYDDVFCAYKLFDESCQRDLVSYNVMIDGFVKAGEIDKARELFDQMGRRDEVSWNTMLAGYAKMNKCKEGILLFDQLMASNLRPDNVALVALLSACAQLGELEKGERVHDYILQKRLKINAYLGTGLVDLYAKCGCISTAREVFESCCEKNVSTWNAMLVGLAMHGDGKLVLDYFSRMVASGVRPDGVTILGVLVGCSHAGVVNEARQIFEEMEIVYGVSRELKHYGCMADLLARAGLIKEAREMIEGMPMGGDVFVWGGLLGGCRIHGDVEMAEKAAEHLMEVKPEDGGVFSIMADVYAKAERWDDLVKVRTLKDSKTVKKIAGCSLIQLNGVTHEFVAGDDLHPCTNDLYLVLNWMEQHQFEAV